jgi:hypothetical protein
MVLVGLRTWVFTISKTKSFVWSGGETEVVMNALKCGNLKAAVKPLCLDENPPNLLSVSFAIRSRIVCKRRKISSSPRSTNSKPQFLHFNTDNGSINTDGNGDHRLPSDTSSEAVTQLAGNSLFSEELPRAHVSHDPVPIPCGSSAS